MKWRALFSITRKDLSLRILAICALILLAGSAITFIIYLTHSSTLEVRQQELISRVHVTIQNSVQREMDRNLEALRALKTAFIAQGKISRSEFHIYSNHYLQNIKSIQALEWVPYITASQRDSLERATREEGFEDFQLIKRNGNEVIRVEDRDEYFPVFYVEPFETNKEAFGFDPGVEGKQRYNAIQESIHSQEAAASDLMKLIQNENQQHAILVFVPIFESDLRAGAPNKIHSLVEGVYLVDSLVSVALANYKIPEPLVVRLEEESNSNTLLFTNAADSMDAANDRTVASTLKMANKEWKLYTFNPGKNPFAVISPYWILVTGFSLSLLLSINVFRLLTDNRKELKEYSRLLENKNKELEQYAYVAAHDLQEPLHTISSLITLVKEDCVSQLDERGKTYVQLIGDASERMTSLIQDLLNYSRMGSVETPQLVNCNDLVTQVVTDMNQLIQDRKASVQFKNLPTVIGYPSALRQLFLNLISNGIKFQPIGQLPVITIEATQQIPHGWQFAVKDNGIGIPMEQRESVFVLFKRLHRKDKYQGNGIGLTYCRKAVEMHNGEIWIESESGNGSTFKFFLNLHT